MCGEHQIMRQVAENDKLCNSAPKRCPCYKSKSNKLILFLPKIVQPFWEKNKFEQECGLYNIAILSPKNHRQICLFFDLFFSIL